MSIHIYYKKPTEGVPKPIQADIVLIGTHGMPEECKALLGHRDAFKKPIETHEVTAKPVEQAEPVKVKKKRGRGRPPGAKSRFKKMNKLVPYNTKLEQRQIEKLKRDSVIRGMSASALLRKLIDSSKAYKKPELAKRANAMREGWKRKIKAELEAEEKE